LTLANRSLKVNIDFEGAAALDVESDRA
jgi:hypothetical protein